MKQIIRLLVLAALLAALFVPSAAFASDKAGGGVYIAPKFIYGVTRLDGIKLYHASGAYTAESKQTEGAFGGALAIGFDFNRRPRILGEGTGPSISAAEERALWVAFRAEVEFAMFAELTGDNHYIVSYGGTEIGRSHMEQYLQIQTLFFNAYLDFHNQTPFSFWLGAGAGAAFIKSDGKCFMDATFPSPPFPFTHVIEEASFASKGKTNFAWNVGFGAVWDVNQIVSVDAGYRFVGLGKAVSGTLDQNSVSYGLGYRNLETKNIYMHQFMLGLRFTF